MITGGLGHLGSQLIRDFSTCVGVDELVVVDNLATQRYCSLFDLSSPVPIRLIESDLLDAQLTRVFDGAACVIHLAALTEPELSLKKPREFTELNYQLTQCVVEACVSSATDLIFPSTTSVYRNNYDTSALEPGSSLLTGQTPYAAGKLSEERLVNEQMTNAGLSFQILRLGTLCGFSAGMRFHTAINRFCWQAVNGQALTLYDGTRELVRPYLTLTDASSLIRQVLLGKTSDSSVANAVTMSLPLASVLDLLEQECEIRSIPVMTKVIKAPSHHMSDVCIHSSETLASQLEPIFRLRLAIRETLNRLSRV